MVTPDIKALLASDSPRDRKRAIQKLMDVGGDEALRALAKVYKYDPDPDVKALAVEAGKRIKQNTAEFMAVSTQTQEIPALRSTQEMRRPGVRATQETPASAGPYTRRALYEEREARENQLGAMASAIGYTPVFVSPSRQSQALESLRDAEEALERGERDKAIQHVVKAFEANPNYRLDAHAMEIGRRSTRTETDAFLAMLEDGPLIQQAVRAAKSGKQKPKPKNEKRKFGEPEELTWGKVALDLGLYYIVLVGLCIIFLMVAAQTYQVAMVTAANGCDGCTRENIFRLRDLLRETQPLLGYAPVKAIGYGFIGASIFFIQLMVYYVVMHVTIHMFFASEGTFREMLHYCARFDFIIYCILLVLLGVAGQLILRDLFDPLRGRSGAAIALTLTNISLLVVIGGGLWSLRRVIVHYRGGCIQMGCTLMIAGFISSSLLGGITNEVTKALFGPALAALQR